MSRAVFYFPLALLFLASVVPTHGQMRRAEPEVTGGEKEVSVALGAPLTVECSLRPEQRAEWKLDGKEVPSDMRPAEAPASEALTARLTANQARAHHAGVYTCAKSSPRIRVRVTGTVAQTTTEALEIPKTEVAPGDVLYYEVRGNFLLNCTSLAGSGKITWKKNNTALENWPELKGHVVTQVSADAEDAVLTLSGRATEFDHGKYSCSNGASELSWLVQARPHAKIPTDTNVVEGQKLKITCKIIGRPFPAVNWTYSNTSEEVINGTSVFDVFGGRVSLAKSEQGVENGDMIIENAQRTDAGWYKCLPLADERANATSSVSRLRVKDMYAALWPFLGICAEVFILCAIILVYEKRRTKPELDDSDTDNHDQKKS